MMGKEHFIETFGVPIFTVSTGGSGGAYTSLQIADAFPGLFDGVVISATFPDALSIALAGLDAHLLTHYFTGTGPQGFTEAQKVAVTGYSGHAGVHRRGESVAAHRSGARARRRAGIRVGASGTMRSRRRCATTRRPIPRARARRSSTRRATSTASIRRPGCAPAFDNVGVQYGLEALNDRVDHAEAVPRSERDASAAYDQDSNYVPARPSAMSVRSGAPIRAA